MRPGRLFILILLLVGGISIYSQNVKSSSGRFHLNNEPVAESIDTTAPVIILLAPKVIKGQVLKVEVDQLDVVGEVSDNGKVRFVSVNREVLLVNETGVFVTSIKLFAGMNEVRLKAMDDNNNLGAKDITIEYNPPVVTLADKINKESTYYGLLIGINDYRDGDLADLDNPIRDAERFYRTLTRNYTFDKKNITVLKNPKRTEIIRELDLLRDKITPDDNLLIFYAGHGYYDKDSECGYWLPADAALETTAEWFPNSTLVNHLRGIHSKHTLLITDACFAGSIFKTRSVTIPQEVIYERIYEQPSRKAMTSGRMTKVPDNSAFIKYLIQRLDENQRKYMSSEELYSGLKNAVISNSNVLPQYGEIQNVGNEGGDFIFLRKE